MPAVKEIDAETKGKIRPAKDKPRQINSGGYYFIAANIFRRRDLLFLAAFISAAINLCLRFILFRLAVFNLPARFRSLTLKTQRQVLQ